MKSISAMNAGTTSGGKACHFQLLRRLRSLNESLSNELFVIWVDGYPSPMESDGSQADVDDLALNGAVVDGANSTPDIATEAAPELVTETGVGPEGA